MRGNDKLSVQWVIWHISERAVIPKSFIQDLLNRLDIVDVVGRYVPLKKAGANFSACCPFHNEKSPSFTVSPSKQFYHCFGCGVHGTAISFVMEHLGLSFVEAVEELARSIGLNVPRETSVNAATQSRAAPDLYELMQTAVRYYREQLKLSQPAIDYLKRRGVSGEVAARFGMGYAPEGWQNLRQPFADYQSSSLLDTGLVVEREDEATGDTTGQSTARRYDRFRDRIMFPIVNARGQVIGFGGRVLDKGTPKYLNSPETVLFEKGRELYGLYQAQKAIRANRIALVVEGYMDVVALAQHGIEYAVATLGTATTPFHIQKLLRLTDRVVFCFDGDAAGRRAAWRALENTLPQLVDGKQFGFLFLPAEHDPDSYVRQFGKEAFEKLQRESMPLSGYLLNELSKQVDMHTQEGKSTLLKLAQPLLSSITAPIAALLLRKELAVLAGVSQVELEVLYGMESIDIPKRRVTQKIASPAASNLRALLRCLLFKPDLARQLPANWEMHGLEADTIAALAEWLLSQEEPVSTAAIIQHFQETAHANLLAKEQAEILQLGDGFNAEGEFLDVLKSLRKAQRKQEFDTLNAKIRGTGMGSLSEQERALYLQLSRRD